MLVRSNKSQSKWQISTHFPEKKLSKHTLFQDGQGQKMFGEAFDYRSNQVPTIFHDTIFVSKQSKNKIDQIPFILSEKIWEKKKKNIDPQLQFVLSQTTVSIPSTRINSPTFNRLSNDVQKSPNPLPNSQSYSLPKDKIVYQRNNHKLNNDIQEYSSDKSRKRKNIIQNQDHLNSQSDSIHYQVNHDLENLNILNNSKNSYSPSIKRASSSPSKRRKTSPIILRERNISSRKSDRRKYSIKNTEDNNDPLSTLNNNSKLFLSQIDDDLKWDNGTIYLQKESMPIIEKEIRLPSGRTRIHLRRASAMDIIKPHEDLRKMKMFTQKKFPTLINRSDMKNEEKLKKRFQIRQREEEILKFGGTIEKPIKKPEWKPSIFINLYELDQREKFLLKKSLSHSRKILKSAQSNYSMKKLTNDQNFSESLIST